MELSLPSKGRELTMGLATRIVSGHGGHARCRGNEQARSNEMLDANATAMGSLPLYRAKSQSLGELPDVGRVVSVKGFARLISHQLTSGVEMTSLREDDCADDPRYGAILKILAVSGQLRKD
jgi:hypothetical protein